ncbi:mucus-binding protein, partial [Limosilactobacillus reuteri]|nr:mucus-binding protein [Limosilactobacillus reuteri]
AGATYDNDDGTVQTYTVVLRHGTQPVTPTDPGKPGEPINPNDPDGPKWPDGTDENSLKKTGTQTVHYVYADGTKAKDDNVQNFDFTKTGVVDKVTGKLISETGWNVSSHTFDRVDSPVIEGYHADKRVAGGETVTPDDLNKEVTVTYTPNGKIIPVDPSGKPIPNVPTPQYPTDPTDPTKVTPDEPVPEIPGYTPSVPTVTPTDPGKDTPVPYTPVTPAKDQQALVNYVDADENNKVITSSGNLSG